MFVMEQRPSTPSRAPRAILPRMAALVLALLVVSALVVFDDPTPPSQSNAGVSVVGDDDHLFSRAGAIDVHEIRLAAGGRRASAWTRNPVDTLIKRTGSSNNVFHLDLSSRGGGGGGRKSSRDDSGSESGSGRGEYGTRSPTGEMPRQQQPWFEESSGKAVTEEVAAAVDSAADAGEQGSVRDVEANRTTAATAVTVVHPIRSLLSYFIEEGIELEESLSWMGNKAGGVPVNASSSSQRDRTGYQFVDNYFVRVLGGRAAWELPPGNVGAAQLKAARIALGKFEVILRHDCLETDLSLLAPYLAGTGAMADIVNGDDEAAAGDNSSEAGMRVEPHSGGEKESFLALPPGEAGRRLVRINRWDLQLWDFANRLAASRSSTLEGYLCGSSELARMQDTPGAGQRAVVFNSPIFHLTGVSMFSCALMSIGFEVTNVLLDPIPGFEQLLPCAHKVIPLDSSPRRTTEHRNGTGGGARTFPSRHSKIVLNDTVAGMLGLLPLLTNNTEEQRPQHQPPGRSGDDDGGVTSAKSDEVEGVGGEAGEGGGRSKPFNVSVLCTAFGDLNVLFDPRHSRVESRLAEALLWNVNVSIWNVHGVNRAFESGGVPPAAHDFAARVPSKDKDKNGRTPPPSFLTVYGEHVGRWEESLEEAYEGWGERGHGPMVMSHSRSSMAPQLASRSAKYHQRGQKETNLRGLFPHPGVVYPIVPTGYMRLPRRRWQLHPPSLQEHHEGDRLGGIFHFVAQSSLSSSSSPSASSRSFSSPHEDDFGNSWRDDEAKRGRSGGGEGSGGGTVALRRGDSKRRRVNFVIQGTMVSARRDYEGLFGCLEAMCTNGRGGFSLDVVGSSGNVTGQLESHPCTSSRYSEGRNLEYEDFYARITLGDFVVTASAGHEYEFDRATSSVPTALLLERPLVMASTLLDAYPCLRNSRVHSMVANDDLCMSLQAAYDLTPQEYDEMELEARDCKLHMWKKNRETIADIIRRGRVS